MGSGQSAEQQPRECEQAGEAGSVARIGQGLGSAVSSTLGQLQGEVLRQTRRYREIADLSYEEFQDCVTELNQISSQFLDTNGKQLVFAVKKGTDSTALWKGTVKVACVKVDSSSQEVDSYRLLNLKQFLAVFRSLQTQTAALREDQVESSSDSSGPDSPGHCSSPHPLTLAKFSASSLLAEALVETVGPASLEECCVCLERRPDVILPCAHSYCQPCIEQWNVNHKTCPVCRETLASTEDGWVISDGPDSLDIATEIQKSLMELAQD